MADNTIDTLELQIISDANKADASLDKLAKKLMDVNRSFISLSGGGLRKFAREIGAAGAAIETFSKIKIKMPEIRGATKEVDRMEKYVSSASKRIANSLSSAFNIKGGDLAGIQKQIQEIGHMLADGNTKGASDAFEPLGKSVIEAASNVRYADEEMERFYQTLLKTSKIKVSPDLPKAMPDDWKNMDGLLRQKISTQSGTELDSLIQEWKENFKGLFSGLDTDTVEDQFVALNKLVKQCREGITDPLADSGLLEDSVWEKTYQDIANLETEIKNTKAVLEATGGTKETQALGFDKFIADLKKMSGIKLDGLSDVGTQLSGLAAGISSLNGLSIDIKPINQAVALFEELGKKKNVSGTENLKQISSNLQEFANSVNSIGNLTSALTDLSAINFDSNNLSRVINSLKNLLSVKMEGFDVSVFPKIVESIGMLSNVPDVSNSLNRLIASLARLAGTGPSITTVANQLPNLGEAVKTAVEKIVSAGNVSGSVNALVQSIAQLANAGSKTGQTAGGLNNLAEETVKFFQTMTEAPKISQNAIAMTQALAQLASAGGKVGTATGTITAAFGKLSGSGNKTASTLRKAAISIVSSFKSIGSGSKHLNTASSSFGKFIKSALPYVGFYQLFNWGKQAVELSSDLTEVQNVVDVTFGNMTDKVDEFTENSIQQFGMSELSAKQFASRFQAMGSAMGINQNLIGNANDYLKEQTKGYVGASDAMADMSLNLTKLTADMASFYNVEQSAVAEDLESIFTGQTRPLRAYGLDLTQATLQEWALKQGLDANMQSMSQAEKTMLRYQYVLANTTAAQGDFSRTADTWANRTRVLVQQFQQLGAIIGGTFINAFKPFVAVLNSVMQKVIAFAETVSEALGAIFGWKIEIGGGGVTNDLGDVSGDMGDIADGTNDAADAAQKLKKSLSVLPFDELNQLAADVNTAGNGGSGVGSGAGGSSSAESGASAAIVPTDSILKAYESEIKNLEQLGAYIGDSLKKAMDGIKWEEIYQKAEGFGTGLADFLNGIIRTPGLFDSVGATVAGALNTPLHSLDSFGRTFDWTAFGDGLADGLTSFFVNYDFGLLAGSLSTWANGLLDSMIAFAEKVEWGGIGDKVAGCIEETLGGIKWYKAYRAASGFGSGIATYLNKLITPSVFGQIGHTVAGTLNTVISGAYSFLGTIKWKQWGASIGESLNTFFSDFDWGKAGLTLDSAVNGVLDMMIDAAQTADWESFGEKVSRMIREIRWRDVLSKVGELIWSAINAGIKFWKGLFGIDVIEDKINGLDDELNLTELSEGLKKLGEALSPFVKGFAQGFLDFFDFLANDVTPAVINALGGALGFIGDMLGKIDSDVAQAIGVGLGSLVGGLAGFRTISTVGKIAVDIKAGVGGLLTSLGSHPYLAIAAGLISVVSGLHSLTKSGFFSSAEAKEAISNADSVISETRNVRDEVRQTLDAIQGKDRDIESTYQVIRNLADEYFALSEKVGLTKTEEEKLQGLRETLSNNLPGFQDIISDTSRTYDDQKTAVDELIGSTEAYYRTLAAQEYMKEYYEKLFDLEVAMQKNRDANDKLMGSYEGLSERSGLLFSGPFASLGELFDGTGSKIRENNEEYDKLKKQLDELNEEYAAQKTVLEGGWEALGTTSQMTSDLATSTETLGTEAENAAGKMEGIGGKIDEYVNGIADHSETAKENARELGGCVPEEMSNSMDSKASLVGGSISGLISSQILKTFNMLLPADVMQTFGGNVSTDFAGGIAGGSDAVTGAITSNIIGASVLGLFKLLLSSLIVGSLGGSFDTNLAGGIEDNSSAVSDATGDVIDSMMDLTKEKLSPKEGNELGLNFALGLADGILNNSDPAKKASENLVNTVFGTIEDLAEIHSPSKVAEKDGEYIDQGLANGISGYTMLVTTAATKVIDALKSLFAFQKDAFNELGAAFMSYLKKGITEQTEPLQVAAGDLIKAIKGIFPEYNNDFYNSGQSFMAELVNAISDSEKEAVLAADEITSAIQDVFGGIGKSLFNKGKNAAKSFANGISSVHIPMPHISVQASTRNTGSGYSYNMSSNVNWYKAGGLFGNPAVIGVGEAGKEVVLPLENKRTMSMIADSITQNAKGLGVDEEMLANAVARGVAMAMMNNQDNKPINLYATLYTENDEVLARAVSRGQQKIDYRMNPTPSYG